MDNLTFGKIFIWLFRRLLLPIILATVAATLAFALSGKATIGDLLGSIEGVAVIASLVAVILIAVVGGAYVFRWLRFHNAISLPLLLVIGSIVGFLQIYKLTETVMFSNWAIPPAIAATIVWMLCNLDLLKRVKKEQTLG